MKHRWVQLVASLIAMIMIANLQYAWTLFVEPIRQATGWKLSDIQWGFTLFIVFETWIMPKTHESAFENSSSHMFENLAKALKTLLTKADRVLDNPPYNLVIHTSPVQDPTNDHYHWHIEFMPKLTKTAGFEWGTGFYINPTPPEEAARFLRESNVEEPVPVAVG